MTADTPVNSCFAAPAGPGAALHPGRRLGWAGTALLALVAAPRVVLHDLHLLTPGSWWNAALAVGPVIVWIAVVLGLRVRRPFLSLLLVGIVHGMLLALIHLLLWDANLGGAPLQLGGRLEDLPLWAHGGIARAAMVISSLFTGAAMGAVAGLAASGLRALTTGRQEMRDA